MFWIFILLIIIFVSTEGYPPQLHFPLVLHHETNGKLSLSLTRDAEQKNRHMDASESVYQQWRGFMGDTCYKCLRVQPFISRRGNVWSQAPAQCRSFLLDTRLPIRLMLSKAGEAKPTPDLPSDPSFRAHQLQEGWRMSGCQESASPSQWNQVDLPGIPQSILASVNPKQAPTLSSHTKAKRQEALQVPTVLEDPTKHVSGPFPPLLPSFVSKLTGYRKDTVTN